MDFLICDKGNFSIDVPSSQVTSVSIKLTKTNQHNHITIDEE